MFRSEKLKLWGRASEEARRLSKIAKRSKARLVVSVHELDADPFKINLENGTLVVQQTSEGSMYITLKPHDPADLITKVMPVKYDPAATCPTYDRFLEEVQPNPAVRRYLHQWGGYCLTGDVSEQKILFNWGKGKNGKSTLLDTWAYILGDYSTTVPIETFSKATHSRSAGQASPDLAMLHAVRMVRASEPERGSKLNEALIKLVTGGEEIAVRHLNRPYFMLRPRFKLIMSGNYRPTIDGADEGIWRRIDYLPWSVTIPEEKRDKHLAEKLRAEASGILNRLLEGLRDWLANGLIQPPEVIEATAEHRDESDPLGQFLKMCAISAKGSRVQAGILHEVFCAWAKATGKSEWSAKGLAKAMQERGYKKSKSDKRYWMDIKLIRTAADFVDANGRPLKDQPGGNPDDEIPY